MECLVCGGKIRGLRCEKCGFAQVVALDDEGREALLKRAAHHKKRVVASVKNISIKTFGEGGEVKKIRLCDGKDCYLKRFTSDAFPPNPAGVTMERILHLSAEVYGELRRYEVPLSPDASLPFWQVAVRLDEDLKFTVMAGAKDNWDFGVVEL